MLEKTLAAKFKQRIERKIPNCFYYKIPDTKGLGGMRPFDSFVLIDGVFFALEFKVAGRKPTEYQRYMLNKARKAGGSALVITDKDDINIIIDALESYAKYKKNLSRKRFRWWVNKEDKK